MPKDGIYYLARLAKMGNLTTDMVIQALLKPKPIVMYGNAWSFTGTKEYETKGIKYVAGRLAKYRPDAEVVIIDPEKRTEMIQQEPNLRMASSPFVYIPEHSGVAFLRVAGQIEEWHFTDRFARIIVETHLRFFVECELNLIADLKTFAAKLKSLAGIYRISAVVLPPNPLFGPLWKPLRDYIKRRRSGQMVIREATKSAEPLNTDLPQIVEKVAAQQNGEVYEPKEELPIGDAAILMAADGYGKGTITGMQEGRFVVIKTSETNRNFSFDKDPNPEELFVAANELFERIKKDRHMEH